MTRILHIVVAVVLTTGGLTGCDLSGIPASIDTPDATIDAGLPGASCPAVPRCGAGNFVEQCAPDGNTLEVVSCSLAELCQSGQCEALTDSCDSSQGRPFRLSVAELAFDVPELLTDCECEELSGCVCEEVNYKSQLRQFEIENCSDRAIFIRDLTMRSTAQRPDGLPVFALDRSYRDIEISPGGSQAVNVVYRPAPVVSQTADSRLDITLIGDSSRSFALPVRTRSFCVTSTPSIPLWTLLPDQEITVESTVQNCGTAPVLITGVAVNDWKGPGEPTVRLGKGFPVELPAGSETPARITISPAEAGLFEGEVQFLFDEPRLAGGTTTRFRGAAAVNGCADIDLPDLNVTVDRNAATEPSLDVRPGQLVEVTPTTLQSAHRPVFTLDIAPKASHGDLFRRTDGVSFMPKVVGSYAIEMRLFDEATRQMSCDSTTIPIDARPTAPLYVELTWETEGDGIDDDFGFGRGADLDLYVLAPAESEAWTDSESACFPESELPCAAGGGERLFLSSSGWNPESYRFDTLEGLTYSFGAYLRNPYTFRGVRASMRVWRNGVPVDVATRESPGADEEAVRLSHANQFWWVATSSESSDIPHDVYLNGPP